MGDEASCSLRSRQMVPLQSDAIIVRDIQHAGRGVVATRFIPSGTVVHTSGPPTVHLIFRDYRKEACANCFFYDRGRTLPVQDVEHGTGKVFCSTECRLVWIQDHGQLGVASWRAFEAFLRSRKRTNDSAMGSDLKPSKNEIDLCWKRSAAALEKTTDCLGGGRKRTQAIATAKVNPDLLSYLLAAALAHHQTPEKWNELLGLVMDEEPYRSTGELEAYCAAYQQLASINLPSVLLASITPELCQTLVSAASHNAFGIRSSDEGEYMGYAIYPSASYFNHACYPNTSKQAVGNGRQFRALRDINIGEECCVTYLGEDRVDLSVEMRRAKLKDVWDFVCGCQTCMDEAR